MRYEDQVRRARAFHDLHQGPAFLLPNAWDPISALILAKEGFPAVATTSGGMSWALGFADGEQAPWPEVVKAVERIANVLPAPLSADIEGGYAESAHELHDRVVEVVGAGAVGFNIEDRQGDGVRELEDACARIAAARAAVERTGVQVFVNARTDIFNLFGVSEQSEEEAGRRVAAYVEAGASGVFLFGLSDLAILKRMASATPVPLNVVGRPGGPSFEAFSSAGARRVSIAAGLALHAYGAARSTAARLRESADFDSLRSDFNRAQAQALTSRPND
ncbi:MAG: carboxyvinyl-carboxyphosphonate phosphorylmutase [Hyphomicrobiales bacterium]|nr:carboxyvinyl-carboxyphosphonate phosphorylmutase [Hyphomicrobiales bacterium]